MAAETGENYFNLRLKIFCMEASKNMFGLEFVECLKRSTKLSAQYFSKISQFTQEINT